MTASMTANGSRPCATTPPDTGCGAPRPGRPLRRGRNISFAGGGGVIRGVRADGGAVPHSCHTDRSTIPPGYRIWRRRDVQAQSWLYRRSGADRPGVGRARGRPVCCLRFRSACRARCCTCKPRRRRSILYGSSSRGVQDLHHESGPARKNALEFGGGARCTPACWSQVLSEVEPADVT